MFIEEYCNVTNMSRTSAMYKAEENLMMNRLLKLNQFLASDLALNWKMSHQRRGSNSKIVALEIVRMTLPLCKVN